MNRAEAEGIWADRGIDLGADDHRAQFGRLVIGAIVGPSADEALQALEDIELKVRSKFGDAA